MLTAYVVRGLKAGAVAGLAFGLFVALVASPLIGYADSVGHQAADSDHGGHAHDEAESHDEAGHAAESGSLVSASVTRAVSVLSGVLWGVLLGTLVFGAAFYVLEPALPGSGAGKSAVLAAAGFVTVSGAPWLVLPPSPPGVGHSLGVNARLALYVGMMALGAVTCALSVATYNRARGEYGRWTAGALALGPFALLSLPALLGPSTAVESALPGDLAAGLVGITVFGQAALWAMLAGSHAWLSRDADAEPKAAARARSDGPVGAD